MILSFFKLSRRSLQEPLSEEFVKQSWKMLEDNVFSSTLHKSVEGVLLIKDCTSSASGNDVADMPGSEICDPVINE